MVALRAAWQVSGHKFTSATVSVPVEFTLEQRAATVRAGEAAGFRYWQGNVQLGFRFVFCDASLAEGGSIQHCPMHAHALNLQH